MADDLWATWAASNITIDVDEATTVLVQPIDAGPGDPLPGELLPSSLHVVTAWNPQGIETDAATNARAQARLAAELHERNLRHWPARGFAADHSWSEDGFAVGGLDRKGGCALGQRYGQLAIFELTDGPDGLRVITSDGIVVSRRAAAVSVTKHQSR